MIRHSLGKLSDACGLAMCARGIEQGLVENAMLYQWKKLSLKLNMLKVERDMRVHHDSTVASVIVLQLQ